MKQHDLKSVTVPDRMSKVVKFIRSEVRVMVRAFFFSVRGNSLAQIERVCKFCQMYACWSYTAPNSQRQCIPSAVWKNFHYSPGFYSHTLFLSAFSFAGGLCGRTSEGSVVRRQIRQEESQNLISRDAPFPSLFLLLSPPATRFRPSPLPDVAFLSRITGDGIAYQNCKTTTE